MNETAGWHEGPCGEPPTYGDLMPAVDGTPSQRVGRGAGLSGKNRDGRTCGGTGVGAVGVTERMR